MESSNDDPRRFLTEEEQKSVKQGMIAGFPRTGNTMTRFNIELITGIYTGSNMCTDIHTLDSLRSLGMKGDTTFGPEVEFIETHFPYYCAGSSVAYKTLVLVRNPFDVIDSFWNLSMTNTHSRHMLEEEYTKYADLHDEFIHRIVKQYDQFYRYWLETQQTPVFIARFEDTVRNTQTSMTNIISFLKDGIDVASSPYQAKIKEVMKRQGSGVYAKKGQSGTNVKSLHRYSQQQFNFICEYLEKWLDCFGYKVSISNKEVEIQQLTGDDYISKRNLDGMHRVKLEKQGIEVCNMNELSKEEQEFSKQEEEFDKGLQFNMYKQVKLEPLD